MNIKSIWDDGGKNFDRYTIVLTDPPNEVNGLREMLGLSSNPEHPQGFSQFTMGEEGKHLGKNIKFKDLPKNIQKHIISRLNS